MWGYGVGYLAALWDAVINGGPGLMMIVEKLPWANTLDVTRGVEAAIEEMRPGLKGIDIDTTIFRPATFIEQSIKNLNESLLIGAVLVVIVLLFFLYEWRVALISATIIPLSLMASLLVLNLRGVTINVMTLAGLAIAIGAVVDDAIVDVENIVRRLRRLRKEGSTQTTASIILEASLEVRGRYRLRVADRDIRRCCQSSSCRVFRGILPAAGHCLRGGRSGFSDGRPDRHAGDGLYPPVQCAD